MNSNLEKTKSIFNSKAISDIYRWSKCVHKGVAAITIIGILSSLFSLAETLVTKSLIDGATSGHASALWHFGSLLVALMAADRVLAIVASKIRLQSNTRLQRHMQTMITNSLLRKEYASLKSYHSGALVSRIFSDVAVVQGGVMNLLPSLFSMFVSFVGAAIILVAMDWRFLPVIIATGVIGFFISMGFRNPMKKRHKRMQEAQAALQANTQETLENIRVVKASCSEDRSIETLSGYRETLAFEQIRNGKLSIMMNQGFGIVFSITWLICNLWGCVKIYQGTFTYGSLAALIQLVGRIQSPIASAVSIVSQAYGVVASAERLEEILDMPDEDEGTVLTDFDEILFKNVNFRYDDGVDDVLTDVNATFKKGDFVALTGISGEGKTTLFQLLMGIYKPSGGEVLFREGDVTVPASRGTRGLFAYVPQGNMLFSGTLHDNLTMFTDSATQEEIDRAVHAACLDDVIANVGYDAVLGERGIGLSEGQAQRVAVARAILSKAPVLLLDEATSALDEDTEAKLLENIAEMRDKTVIIVTHRRAALAFCDHTFHILDGKLIRIDRTETD